MARPALPPEPLDSFHGREADVARLVQMLSYERDIRLITLEGPGGIGKTRLALRVLHEVADEFDGRVAFVDLTAITEPAEIPIATAYALGVIPERAETVESQIISAIGDDEWLICFDNFEHLLSGAMFVSRMLNSNTAVSIVCTSRERLKLKAEQTYRVSPLAMPVGDETDLESAMNSPAIQLFIDRARSATGSFDLEMSDTSMLIEVCERLDAHPLNLELAAARMRSLDLRGLRSGLDDATQLLVTDAPEVPLRQRSLTSNLQASYSLLDVGPRTALRRLSALQSLAPMEIVEPLLESANQDPEGAAGQSSRSLLDRLAQANLLETRQGVSGRLFGVSEVVRQFGRSVTSAEEKRANESLIAEIVHDLAIKAEPEFQAEDPKPWLDLFEDVRPTLNQSLRWLVDEGAKTAETAVLVAGRVWHFWKLRGYGVEGGRLLQAAVEAGESTSPEIQANGLIVLGHLELSDNSKSLNAYMRALSLYEVVNDEYGIARAHSNIGMSLTHIGRYDEAQLHFSEALGRLNAEEFEWARAVNHYHLGQLGLHRGDVDYALAQLDLARTGFQRSGDTGGVAHALLAIGGAYLEAGNSLVARDTLTWGLRLQVEIGAEDGIAQADALLGRSLVKLDPIEALSRLQSAIAYHFQISAIDNLLFASIESVALLFVEDRASHAVELLAASDRERLDRNIPRTPGWQLQVEKSQLRLRELHPPDVYEYKQLSGSSIPFRELVAMIRNAELSLSAALSGPVGASEKLTKREQQIACLVATESLTDREIADRLHISLRTVETHIGRVLAKLQVNNRTAAAASVLRQNLCQT